MATSPEGEAAIREADREQVLKTYAIYPSVTTVADKTGFGREYVSALLREAAEELKRNNAEHVSCAAMQQDAAICHLYEICVKAILDSPVFPEKAILCAIKLMERRSRLLGFDKDKGPTKSGGGFGWLDKAGPAELEAVARSYGIPVPVPFAS